MFLSLGVALGQVASGIFASQLEATLTSSYYTVTVFCLILSLSELPNSMEKSSEQFRNLYNRRLAENCVLKSQPYTMQNLKLLKATSAIKPVYCTVWVEHNEEYLAFWLIGHSSPAQATWEVIFIFMGMVTYFSL
ncbi:hypothetical protein AVEN_225552-1, partial [Araneus ventricosus]